MLVGYKQPYVNEKTIKPDRIDYITYHWAGQVTIGVCKVHTAVETMHKNIINWPTNTRIYYVYICDSRVQKLKIILLGI